MCLCILYTLCSMCILYTVSSVCILYSVSECSIITHLDPPVIIQPPALTGQNRHHHCHRRRRQHQINCQQGGGKLSKVAYTGVSTDTGAHISGVISSTRKTTIRDFEEDRHSIIASAEAVIISGSTGLPSVNSLHTSRCTPLSQKEIFSHTPLSQIATERYSRMPTDFIQPIPLSLSLKYFWVEFMQTWYFHIFFPALFRDPMKAFYCTGFPFFRSRLSLYFPTTGLHRYTIDIFKWDSIFQNHLVVSIFFYFYSRGLCPLSISTNG